MAKYFMYLLALGLILGGIGCKTETREVSPATELEEATPSTGEEEVIPQTEPENTTPAEEESDEGYEDYE